MALCCTKAFLFSCLFFSIKTRAHNVFKEFKFVDDAVNLQSKSSIRVQNEMICSRSGEVFQHISFANEIYLMHC